MPQGGPEGPEGPEGPGGPGAPMTGMKRDIIIGVTIGIVTILFSLILFYYCLKHDIGFLSSRAIGKRLGNRFRGGKSSYLQDPEMQQQQQLHHPGKEDEKQHIANASASESPSTARSSHLYVDGKVELAAYSSAQHPKATQTVVEIDGSPVGPVELPTEPAASEQSRQINTSTYYQYTSRPSYILSEEKQALESRSGGEALGPKELPAVYHASSTNGSDGKLQPLTRIGG